MPSAVVDPMRMAWPGKLFSSIRYSCASREASSKKAERTPSPENIAPTGSAPVPKRRRMRIGS